MIGGVCINTGTVPSKTLREAVLYLTGLSQRDLYGSSYRVKDEITVADLAARTQHVIARQTDVIRNQLARNHIQMVTGMGRFADTHSIWVDGGSGCGCRCDQDDHDAADSIHHQYQRRSGSCRRQRAVREVRGRYRERVLRAGRARLFA